MATEGPGDIDQMAEQGFGAQADAYERGRPGYPPEAVARLAAELGLGPGRQVLDLAAGTGKMTRPLVETGAEVVAVEPVDAMRDVLAAACPTAEVLDGTAEAVPLPDGSVDAAVVAQAFHWFDVEPALAELHRVLRPGGGLALVWNRRDETVPWVAAMSEVMGWYDYPVSSYERTPWPDVLADAGGWGPTETATVRWEMPTTRAGLADRVRSVSYLAAGPEARREEVVAAVLDLVAERAEPFALPYVTMLFWCRRTA